MPIEITIPRLGWSMEEGIFVGWHKQNGDAVRPGDVLFSLEGDKAIQEVECLDSGILRIPPTAPAPGAMVRVGAVIGFIDRSGEATGAGTGAVEFAAGAVAAVGDVAAKAIKQPAGAGVRGDTSAGVEQVADRSSARPPRQNPAITPRAKRIARELGLDWTRLVGTGPGGRIRERDVRSAAADELRAEQSVADARLVGEEHSGTSAHPEDDKTSRQAITPLRRQITERLQASAQTAVPVTLATTADATRLVALRQNLLAARSNPHGLVPSITELFVKLAAEALRQHPALNSEWTDDAIVVHREINIGVAVDTDAGLLVPVIRGVPELSLWQIAIQSRDLAARARDRRLRPDELQGGTFTVTNLGAFGIDAFTPILNPPQGAVLGIGRIARRPAVVNDQVIPRDLVSLSLTFDHRLVDGAPAARFLQSLVAMVEDPSDRLRV
jgi:pyruvate dehydrogenase E2 component (dihydrolipoamide acetyltransferase)